MLTLDQIKDDYNWESAFTEGSQNVNPVLGFNGMVVPFTIESIEEILAIEEGENDGAPWVGLFILHDNIYGYISAGCDYTGWDCRAWGIEYIGDDLYNMIRYGLDNESRSILAPQLKTHTKTIKIWKLFNNEENLCNLLK